MRDRQPLTPAQSRALLDIPSNGGWPRKKRPTPPPDLDYEAWVHAAGYHPDQNHTWRHHEQFARLNYAGLEFDMGGES